MDEGVNKIKSEKGITTNRNLSRYPRSLYWNIEILLGFGTRFLVQQGYIIAI